MSLAKVVIATLVGVVLLPGAAVAGPRFLQRDEPLDAARELAGGTRLLAPRAAPFRFDLVGLRWRGSGDVSFRTRAAGRWSSWRPARPEPEDLPDRSSQERAAARRWTIGNPYWTGPAGAIQLRVSGDVRRLRASYVRSPRLPLRSLTTAETPAIVPRSAWGADEAIVRAKPYYATRVAFAIVHHTAGRAPATPDESAAIVRAIQTYHVKGNGWNDVGYNFLVDPFGQVFEGRGGGVDRNVVGAHAEGFNTGSVGIAVLGTYGGGTITDAARDALSRLIAWRLDVAHVDPASLVTWLSAGNSRFPSGIPVTLTAVAGHRDTGFTSCPGAALHGELFGIAAGAQAIGLPKLWEPGASGTVGGPIRFTGRLSEALPWTVTVTDGTGAAVATGSGTGPGIDWTWDSAGSRPGTYGYRIDAGPTVLPAIGTIGAEVALDVTRLKAEPAAITPNGDGASDGTEISFALTAPASASVKLLDAAGSEVTTLVGERSFPAGSSSIAWNGTTSDGTPVPDGRYRIAVVARGDTKEVYRSALVVVDRSLAGLAVRPGVFSPNGDGRLDTLAVSFQLAQPAGVRVRVLAGKRSLARVFGGDLGAGSHTVTWTGRRRLGAVRDGAYAIVVESTTPLGTRTLGAEFSIDATPPRVAISSMRVRRGATKVHFTLTEPARLKVWLDGVPFTIDRPAGAGSFWHRTPAQRIRVVAWDAAGNRSRPAIARQRR